MKSEEKQIYAGIDLGGTSITVGIIDDDGNTLVSDNFPTEAPSGPVAIIGRIAERTKRLGAQQGLSFEEVVAVGVGSPGPLDLATGTVILTPNLKWENVPLRDMLAERLGKPVVVRGDAVAATFGEWWAGAGKPYQDVVGLTLGTGVGGGIVLAGRLHEGFRGIGGHIGHMIIVAGGRRCGCGNLGCLEAYASATGIVGRTQEALAKEPDSMLHGFEKPLTAKKIFEAAQEGDKLALHIFKETAWYLAVAINSILNVLNPEAVILMGAVANAGELLFRPLRDHVKDMAFPGIYESTKILKGELGVLAGVVGAAGIAKVARADRLAQS